MSTCVDDKQRKDTKYNISKKALLIVIEGIDKAGKGTQATLLADALDSRGYRCKVISFPDYSTPIGKEIYAFLHKCRDYPLQVKHMLLSANRWEKKDEIEQALQEYDCVIMNRYYHSNLAYGCANNLDLEWLENLDKGLPREDLVIVIDICVEESIYRIRKDSMHRDDFERVDMLKKVADVYKMLASKYNWIVIDGNRSKEEIHKDILNIVIDRLTTTRSNNQ